MTKIPIAEGVQLDNIGTVLGLTRTEGQSDGDYAKMLRKILRVGTVLKNGLSDGQKVKGLCDEL